MNTSIGFRVNTVEKEKLSKLAIEKNVLLVSCLEQLP